MSDKTKEYKRKWMVGYRKRKKEAKLLKNNQCPVCTIFLDPENEIYHKDCPYYKAHPDIHAKLNNKSKV